ncbi:AAA family ATPase [Nannocystis pusilla]|uniref:AAA family ATPase n=1 Tax=Nannocystis pusilla TaxID=889268 RepID=UPI003B7F9444
MSDGKRGFQLERYVKIGASLRQAIVRRLNAARHVTKHDWAQLVDDGLGSALPAATAEREAEMRARQEKTAALAELYSSRISVLIGAAGTGKTTLLRMLCTLAEVKAGNVLLLAPTGKARVRLEQATQQRGQGKTLAQFLLHYRRYDLRTGRYFTNPNANKCTEARTVIVDECSMLTEEQLGGSSTRWVRWTG